MTDDDLGATLAADGRPANVLSEGQSAPGILR
jgi:hypothetical protein